MAEAEKVMGVSADDIEKIMGVEKADIEKMMGVEIPSATWYGARGVQAGGSISGTHGTNQMQYQTVTSSSDTADFGNLTVGRSYGAPACGGGGRMVFGDGATSSVYSLGMMDYILFRLPGEELDLKL